MSDYEAQWLHILGRRLASIPCETDALLTCEVLWRKGRLPVSGKSVEYVLGHGRQRGARVDDGNGVLARLIGLDYLAVVGYFLEIHAPPMVCGKFKVVEISNVLGAVHISKEHV